jgi:hypothetical protein
VCGQAAGPEVVECPNCGNDLSQYRESAAGLSSIQGSPPAPVPSPEPDIQATRSGRGAGPRAIAALLVIALLVPGALFLKDQVEGVLDELTDPGSDSPTESTPPGFGGDSLEGFAGVHDIVRTLRLNGVRCKDVNIQTSSPIVDAGSCQYRGVPVTVTVYFDAFALNAVIDSMEDTQFTYVLKDNAIVLCSDRATARRIKSALGGQLHLPAG